MSRKIDNSRARRKALKPLKSTFPTHLRVDTPEQWRALKRTEWRSVMAAINLFQHGAAYVPAGRELYDLCQMADRISEQIEAADWIAW